MKGPTSQKRFDDATKLLDFGFANFSNSIAVKKDQVMEKIKIEKANIEEIEIITENDILLTLNECDILFDKPTF